MSAIKMRHIGLVIFWLLAAIPQNGRAADAPFNGYVVESRARIGSLINVVLTNVPDDQLPALSKAGNVVLNLRGVPFPGLCTNSAPISNTIRMQFLLSFNSTNRLQWAQVVRNHENIPVSVGVDKAELNCGNGFSLVAMDPVEEFLAGALLLLFGYVSIFLVTRTEMVRDPAPPETPPLANAAAAAASAANAAAAVAGAPPAAAQAAAAQAAAAQAAAAQAAAAQAAAAQAAAAQAAAAQAAAAQAAAAQVAAPAPAQAVAALPAAALVAEAPAGVTEAALLATASCQRDKGRTNALVWAVPLVAAAIAVDRADSSWNDTFVSVLTAIFLGVTIFWSAWHYKTYWKSTKKAADALRPYSLARVQMAVWFFLIVCSWVFLWMLTGTFNTLTNTVLALMGIGAGTALGAEVQDAGKATAAEGIVDKMKTLEAKIAQQTVVPTETRELASLHKQLKTETDKEPPTTDGFFDDMITDTDGISFHRFQMFVWTVVLGIVFVVQVCEQLSMPDFDATLLALMGISSGTYLGFMIKEPHSAATAQS
ncbi:MAG TPA: hypothetical protein VGO59_00260 [Verrucomicrobiae bacterium]